GKVVLLDMLNIQSFVFNAYQENTYLLYNKKGDTVIVDPGMNSVSEIREFSDFIRENSLTPTVLLNTHCHIDHVLGNKFIFDEYGLIPNFHEEEIPVLLEVGNYAPQMGFHYEAAPIPQDFLVEHDTITIGEDKLEAIFVPGHSPGHLCYFSRAQSFLIGGDTLFHRSIGRTDLPGGDHNSLLTNIRNKLYSLPENVVVF